MESTRQSEFRALTSAEVALQTIEDVLACHPDCATVALIENRAEGRGIAMPVEGPDPGPEYLQKLDELLLRAVGDDPGCRLVLASVRSGHMDAVEEDDLDHWRRLQARHADRACCLLDWFIIAPESHRARSMAGWAGCPPQW